MMPGGVLPCRNDLDNLRTIGARMHRLNPSRTVLRRQFRCCGIALFAAMGSVSCNSSAAPDSEETPPPKPQQSIVLTRQLQPGQYYCFYETVTKSEGRSAENTGDVQTWSQSTQCETEYTISELPKQQGKSAELRFLSFKIELNGRDATNNDYRDALLRAKFAARVDNEGNVRETGADIRKISEKYGNEDVKRAIALESKKGKVGPVKMAASHLERIALFRGAVSVGESWDSTEETPWRPGLPARVIQRRYTLEDVSAPAGLPLAHIRTHAELVNLSDEVHPDGVDSYRLPAGAAVEYEGEIFLDISNGQLIREYLTMTHQFEISSSRSRPNFIQKALGFEPPAEMGVDVHGVVSETQKTVCRMK